MGVVDLCNEITKAYTLTVWSHDGSRRPTYAMEFRLKSQIYVMRFQKPIHLVCVLMMAVIDPYN